MKKLLLSPITALCLMGMLLTTSCGKNKDDDGPTPETSTYNKLLGTWHVEDFADDDNRNGLIEESEKYGIDSTEAYRFIFDENDKFTSIYEDLTDPQYNETTVSKWTLNKENTEITIIYSDSTYTDTSVGVIQTLTANQLIMYNKADPYSDWIFLTR